MKKILAALAFLSTGLIGLSAEAGPAYVLQDGYAGGIDTYALVSGSNYDGTSTIDSVGGNPFLVSDIQVYRSGTNGSTLNITVDTNYAGHSGTDGTVYGDLFLNKSWSPQLATSASQMVANWEAVLPTSLWSTPTQQANLLSLATAELAKATPTNYLGDVYQPGDWGYAVAKSPITGAYSLYKITDSSWTDGSVILSNVNGVQNCLATYPVDPSCGWYYRSGEAVSIDTSKAQAIASVSVSIANDKSITYSFNDGGILGNDFALSWAITCANDIVQGVVHIPEPASIMLMLIGLSSLGFIAARRRAQLAAQTHL